MKTAASKQQLEDLADEVFDLVRVISALRSRSRATGPEELSESEFVALDLLTENETLTVGVIQKRLGILPAQMSRLLRALEDKNGKALVKSSINPKDRRRVDVALTDAGKAAYDRYRAARRATSLQWLQHLEPEERDGFMQLIRTFRDKIAKQLQEK
ncbi:MAG: MarR family winged helix-turn-helix transcriptional regulator [Planctomycetota bacterium]|jgi:DNA-binding MarR family transcriptional regulator